MDYMKIPKQFNKLFKKQVFEIYLKIRYFDEKIL